MEYPLSARKKKVKTHCAQGHEFALPGVTYTFKVGNSTVRVCKLCRTDRMRKARKRQRDAR